MFPIDQLTYKHLYMGVQKEKQSLYVYECIYSYVCICICVYVCMLVGIWCAQTYVCVHMCVRMSTHVSVGKEKNIITRLSIDDRLYT